MLRKVIKDDMTIEFDLELKKIKNMNIHINRDGEVKVSAPTRMPLYQIDEFVKSKAEWIVKNQSEIIKKKEELTNTNYLMYLGKKKRLVLYNSTKNYCKWVDDVLEVHLDDYDKFESILYKFLKTETKRILSSMYDEIYDLYMEDYSFIKPVMKIRKMTSRYGSCEFRKGIITLNESLIHYDLEFIRYVIIHEFAHMIEPNHSKSFYAVVSKYMSNYKAVFDQGAKFDL